MSEKGRRRPNRAFVFLFLVLAIAGATWAGWNSLASESGPSVMTAGVGRADIEETVLASGMLKPQELVAVGAQASGRLLALHASVGQVMRKGALIAEIDSLTQQNALGTAQSALANAKAQKVEKQANLSYAEAVLERQANTLANRVSTKDAYESALATVNVTKAQIDALDAQIAQAEIAVSTAKVNLGYTSVTAPIDGTVLAVVTQAGQTVNAIQSAPTIVILGRTDVMRVQAQISEVDVVRVKAGQSVYFTILGDPDRRYEATLFAIEPAPDSITSDSSFSSSGSGAASSASSSSSSQAIYYNAVFDVPNPDNSLLTYMTAEVHVVIASAKNALAVPTAALTDRKPGGVYSVRVRSAAGVLEERSVRTGVHDDAYAQVLEGLSEGEQVVTGEAAPEGAAPSRRRGPPPMM